MTAVEKAARAEKRHQARRKNVLHEVVDAHYAGLTFDQLASDLGVQPDSLRVRIDRLELRDEVDAYYPRKHKGPPRSVPVGRLCTKGHPLVNTPHSVWWAWCPTCQRDRRAQTRRWAA